MSSEKLTFKEPLMTYDEYSSGRLHRGQKGYYEQQKEQFGIKDFDSRNLKVKNPNLSSLEQIATGKGLVQQMWERRNKLALGLYEQERNIIWRDNFTEMLKREYGVSQDAIDRINNFPKARLGYLEKLIPNFDAWWDSKLETKMVDSDKRHFLGTDDDYDTYLNAILDFAEEQVE